MTDVVLYLNRQVHANETGSTRSLTSCYRFENLRFVLNLTIDERKQKQVTQCIFWIISNVTQK